MKDMNRTRFAWLFVVWFLEGCVRFGYHREQSEPPCGFTCTSTLDCLTVVGGVPLEQFKCPNAAHACCAPPQQPDLVAGDGFDGGADASSDTGGSLWDSDAPDAPGDAGGASRDLGGGPDDGPPQQFHVGGKVRFMQGGASIILRNNAADQLTVSSNGAFTFPIALRPGEPYTVTITAEPPGQACHVERSTGTVTVGNVSDVLVSCTVALESSTTDVFQTDSQTYIDVSTLKPIALELSDAADVFVTLTARTGTRVTNKNVRHELALDVDGSLVAEAVAKDIYWGLRNDVATFRTVQLAAGRHTVKLRARGVDIVDTPASFGPVVLTVTVLDSLTGYLGTTENTDPDGSQQISGPSWTEFGIPAIAMPSAPTAIYNYLFYFAIPSAWSATTDGTHFMMEVDDGNSPFTAAGFAENSKTRDTPVAAAALAGRGLGPAIRNLRAKGRSLGTSPVTVDVMPARLGVVSFDARARLYSSTRAGTISPISTTSYVPIQDLGAIDLDFSSTGPRKVLLSLATDRIIPVGNGNTGSVAITVDGAVVAQGSYASENSGRSRSVQLVTVVELDAAGHSIQGRWKNTFVSSTTSMASGPTVLTALVVE